MSAAFAPCSRDLEQCLSSRPKLRGGVKPAPYNLAHPTCQGMMIRALVVSINPADWPAHRREHELTYCTTAETPARRRIQKAASTNFHMNSTTNTDSQSSRGPAGTRGEETSRRRLSIRGHAPQGPRPQDASRWTYVLSILPPVSQSAFLRR